VGGMKTVETRSFIFTQLDGYPQEGRRLNAHYARLGSKPLKFIQQPAA
jgi:hypothetical protein